MHDSNTTEYSLKKQLKDLWDRAKAISRIQFTDMIASTKENRKISNK